MPESNKLALDDTKRGFRLINLYADGTFQSQVKRVADAYQLDTAAKGY